MAIIGDENIDIIIDDDNCDNRNDVKNIHNNHIDNDEQQHFNQWIYCITVVNFDIEIGQSIECIYPKDAQLTEKE
ncbi:hypothetical protein BLA29_006741, partial [Euroglyphus maynei]